MLHSEFMWKVLEQKKEADMTVLWQCLWNLRSHLQHFKILQESWNILTQSPRLCCRKYLHKIVKTTSFDIKFFVFFKENTSFIKELILENIISKRNAWICLLLNFKCTYSYWNRYLLLWILRSHIFLSYS